MTAKEILDIVNQYDYDEAAPLLETILSEHLRGEVYPSVINKYVEALYFKREYYKRMMDTHYYPQAVLDSYIERWGIDGLVKYLTKRENDERQ